MEGAVVSQLLLRGLRLCRLVLFALRVHDLDLLQLDIGFGERHTELWFLVLLFSCTIWRLITLLKKWINIEFSDLMAAAVEALVVLITVIAVVVVRPPDCASANGGDVIVMRRLHPTDCSDHCQAKPFEG